MNKFAAGGCDSAGTAEKTKDESYREEGSSATRKGLAMLTVQSHCDALDGKGIPKTNFAQLRSRLANPSLMDGESRQRLVVLAQRLARVRALGGKYSRVDMSDYAMETLLGGVAIA